MPYFLIIALQLACAFHVYKSNNSAYWYLLIFLAPVLGSIIYILTQVFSKNDVVAVQKEITAVVNPTKKVRELEKKVAFADTFQNKLDLADGYLEMNDFAKAIVAYNEALVGSHKDDYYGNCQLINAYYQMEAYEDVISITKIIREKHEFEGSKSQFQYGLSLYKSDQWEKAEKILKKIDKRYSNYEERLILAKFYLDNEKKQQGLEILNEMKEESKHMTKPNKRKYLNTFTEIEKLYVRLQTNA